MFKPQPLKEGGHGGDASHLSSHQGLSAIPAGSLLRVLRHRDLIFGGLPFNTPLLIQLPAKSPWEGHGGWAKHLGPWNPCGRCKSTSSFLLQPRPSPAAAAISGVRQQTEDPSFCFSACSFLSFSHSSCKVSKYIFIFKISHRLHCTADGRDRKVTTNVLSNSILYYKGILKNQWKRHSML